MSIMPFRIKNLVLGIYASRRVNIIKVKNIDIKILTLWIVLSKKESIEVTFCFKKKIIPNKSAPCNDTKQKSRTIIELYEIILQK